MNHRTVTCPTTSLLDDVGKLIIEGHSVRIKATGNSMLPVFRNGDRVLLVPPVTVCLYDVVLARLANGSYVLHRVIDQQNDGVILMGDGNIIGREQCQLTDIIAKASLLYRGEGVVLRLDGFLFRLFSRVWVFLRPIRRYLLYLYKKLTK